MVRNCAVVGAVLALLGAGWVGHHAGVSASAKFPPLELPGYALPRPAIAVREAYTFAAEHPEVLTYMPCFCGCEHSGHRSNEDCFVASRARNGDVTRWNDHGMVCAMCLAVAERAKRLHESGASVRDIRRAVERELAPRTSTRTPTPDPPAR